MVRVEPDGSIGDKYAIVGEAPASEEVRMGRGFVGPSGKMLWPMLRRLAGIERWECWVTNLCKHPLDNSEKGDAKLSPEEFESCQAELLEELSRVGPTHVLAVGALAARALIPGYTRMEVHNGMSYRSQVWADKYCAWWVTPCWHPAAALHGDVGKDPLAWAGDAMMHFGPGKSRVPTQVSAPPWLPGMIRPTASVISVDTEGTIDDPICLTWADNVNRYYVPAEHVPVWWNDMKAARPIVVYHNAPWDWGVLEAMGVPKPWEHPFRDTMELAYLKQTEPQGLKDLSLRHFGVRMRTWEEVVMPHYEEVVLAIGAGKVDAGTTITTHSPKTGKAYKKPKVQYADEVKAMKRALENPKLMRERIGEFPGPSLRFVPEAETIEYATLDPWMTLKVWEVLK